MILLCLAMPFFTAPSCLVWHITHFLTRQKCIVKAVNNRERILATLVPLSRGIRTTVQLRGNVALTCYSTLEPRDLDTPYSCSDAHNVSTSQVVNHYRTDLLENYQWLLVRVEYYTCV